VNGHIEAPWEKPFQTYETGEAGINREETSSLEAVLAEAPESRRLILTLGTYLTCDQPTRLTGKLATLQYVGPVPIIVLRATH